MAFNLNVENVKGFYHDSKPVIYCKRKYLINSINELKQTVGLIPLSVIGQSPSPDKDKTDIPFDELEV